MPAAELPLVDSLPFVALLFAIALAPLARPQHHKQQGLDGAARLGTGPRVPGNPAPELLHEKFHEYIGSSSSSVRSSS